MSCSSRQYYWATARSQWQAFHPILDNHLLIEVGTRFLWRSKPARFSSTAMMRLGPIKSSPVVVRLAFQTWLVLLRLLNLSAGNRTGPSCHWAIDENQWNCPNVLSRGSLTPGLAPKPPDRISKTLSHCRASGSWTALESGRYDGARLA